MTIIIVIIPIICSCHAIEGSNSDLSKLFVYCIILLQKQSIPIFSGISNINNKKSCISTYFQFNNSVRKARDKFHEKYNLNNCNKKGLSFILLRNEANQNKQIIFILQLFIWFVGVICSINSSRVR